MFEEEKISRSLHNFVLMHDWKLGFDLILEIVRDKRCDLGTLLLVYWLFDPVDQFSRYAGTRSRVPKKSLTRYDILLELEKKISYANYASHYILYNPGDHLGKDLTKPRKRKLLKRRIPGYMFGPNYSKLAQMTSTELHDYVESYNWDEGNEQMFIAARSKNCNLGTALLIYWLADPIYYFSEYSKRNDVDNEFRATYDFLLEIEQKVSDSFYRNHDICFDPGNYSGADWTAIDKGDAPLKRAIPEVMYGPHYSGPHPNV